MSGDNFLWLLEGETYTPTGRTLFKNLRELAGFRKYFHWDLVLISLHVIHDIFTLLGHILKSAVSNHVGFVLSKVFVFMVFVNTQSNWLNKLNFLFKQQKSN